MIEVPVIGSKLTMYSCNVSFGFKPIISFKNFESAFKKCGNDAYNGKPCLHSLKLCKPSPNESFLGQKPSKFGFNVWLFENIFLAKRKSSVWTPSILLLR